MPVAVNPETGERMVLVGGQWVPVTKTAINPDTGEVLGLAGGQWVDAMTAPERKTATEDAKNPNAAYWRKALAGQGSISNPAPVKAGLGSVVRGVANTARATNEAGQQIISDAVDVPFLTPSQQRASREAQLRETIQTQSRQQTDRPEFDSALGRGLYGAVESTIQQIPGIAASIATGNAAPAIGWASAMSGVGAYGKYRARGGTPGEAAVGGALEGGIEGATELIPMGRFVGAFGKEGGKSFLKQAMGSVLVDVPGEQIATLAQDAVDTAIANPNKTWGEYLKERPNAALETFVATVGQGAIMTGGGYAIDAGIRRVSNRPVAPGVIETAQVEATTLTDEDRASPLPDSLIAQGKAAVASSEAMGQADTILEQNGMPRTQTRVTVTEPGGATRTGVIEDAYQAEDGAGVRIKLDDGTTYLNHFDDIRDAGDVIAPMSADQIDADLARQAAESGAKVDAMLETAQFPTAEREATPSPTPPISSAPPVDTATSGDAVAEFMRKTRRAESGGSDTAKNPRSTATGRYQFTNGTWLRL